MYKSPIDVITSQVDNAIMQMKKQQEDYIFQAISNVGVNVDKDELIRALQYDRGQYEKGYRDGVRAVAERFKRICEKDGFVDRYEIIHLLREIEG
ncbi:MAG: hypothetical protein IJ300_09740 [Clostridia bacterium]|nr:hypothetical protein [Clostridia bacterium]